MAIVNQQFRRWTTLFFFHQKDGIHILYPDYTDLIIDHFQYLSIIVFKSYLVCP